MADPTINVQTDMTIPQAEALLTMMSQVPELEPLAAALADKLQTETSVQTLQAQLADLRAQEAALIAQLTALKPNIAW